MGDNLTGNLPGWASSEMNYLVDSRVINVKQREVNMPLEIAFGILLVGSLCFVSWFQGKKSGYIAGELAERAKWAPKKNWVRTDGVRYSADGSEETTDNK